MHASYIQNHEMNNQLKIKVFVLMLTFSVIVIAFYQFYENVFLSVSVKNMAITLSLYGAPSAQNKTSTLTEYSIQFKKKSESDTFDNQTDLSFDNGATSRNTLVWLGHKHLNKKSVNMIKAFKENHKRIVNNKTINATIVFIGRVEAGYGNAMYSLLSGFVVALVTNSAIIVNWTEIDRYIQEPVEKCFQTGTNLDNELNYLNPKYKPYSFPYLTANSFNEHKQLASIWKWSNIEFDKRRLLLTGIGAIFIELCAEKAYFQLFLDYGFVSNKTIEDARKVLEKDPPPNTNDNLNKLYRVGFEVAHSILNIFWRPSAYLQKEVDYYYEKYFKNNFVIGIQLRYWYAEWADTPVFIQCALDIEKTVNKSVKWFVTSDEEDKLSRLIANYSGKIFTSNGTIAHFVSSTKGYLRTLLDIELMSRADEIIITGGSTYGFMSSLKSGKYPLFVNGRVKAKKCERFSFSNPSLTPGQVAAVI